MADSTFECFLLTANCRDNGPRCEITLWAAGEPGARARITVTDFRPVFFCPRTVPAAETAAAAERKPLPMRSLSSGDADCLYFNTYAAMQQTARHLRDNGYPVFESDINPLARYLMERMVSGSMRVTGNPRRWGNFTAVVNPHLRGGTFVPNFRAMAVCIDTNEDESIQAISCAEEGAVHKITGGSERRILSDFMTCLMKQDPDILIGWKAAGFTLRIIRERCEKNDIPFELGREKGSRVASSERSRSWRTETITRTVWSAKIPGRVVMDLPSMLRTYNHPADDCRLDFTDSEACAKDILKIFNDAEVLPNAIERSRRTGQTLESVGGSVASFEHLYLPRLHRAGFVANDTADITMPSQPLAGGYVLEPTPGLYDNVLVFDFKSLYPSIVMSFMIDPLGFKVINGDDDKITTPIGTSFSRTNSILPEIIRELMAGRAAATEQKNPYLSTAIKLLMNSFAGVLGSTGCRFFSEHLSGSITKTGQHILKISIEHIEKVSGKKVIYGDTDSIFLDLGKDMEDKAAELGKSISKETGAWLREHLKEKYDANSALELKYECHFRRFFIPPLRHGGTDGQGTKKHYCGAAVDSNGKMELTFRGMESARNDWTDLAKEFQHELFIKLFSGQPLEEYIIATTEHLQRGDYDDKLIYKKRMRKSMDSYTVNVPPHVQAAKLLGTPVRLVRYYITKDGPQPVEKLSAPLDYQHYIDSQLGPVADSILWWTGKNFDKLISGQQDLFG
ncbi:MAG: hypothetical protein FWB85_09150 [Chitinispirillia bacterium]|nr:hypothetical protein [Chitinispirillia bacterium]MCL2242371.1 hypothetical protein [Chitinispirillia bacterium]